MQKITAGKFHFEPPSRFTSFDYLVGACRERRRYLDPERLRGFQIDDELELGRLHDWQVGRLLALEDARGIEIDLTVGVGYARSIAHQTTGLDEFAQFVDRRNGVVGRKRHELFASTVEERVGADQQGVGAHSG